MSDIEYKKVKDVKDGKFEFEYTTIIRPIPPFYLLVPSINEMPPSVLKENEGKSFALGKFYDTDEEAIEVVKDAGYTKSQMKILESQGYLRTKKKLEELVWMDEGFKNGGV